jgi:hypothetical protein
MAQYSDSAHRAPARPAYASVVKAENCACPKGDMAQYSDSVHRAPARPAYASVVKAENCACAIETWLSTATLCTGLQPDLRMCK